MLKIGSWYIGSPMWLLALIGVAIIGVFLFKYELRRVGIWKVTHFNSPELQRNALFIRTLRIILYSIGALGLSSLIIALARPYSIHHEKQIGLNYNEGIDIVLALDISASMLEEDFYPNRLEVAKKVARNFVNGRKFDRIGLVVYAGEAFSLCPPTSDYDMLIQKINNISSKIDLEDGTAIGLGLGTAVSRLRNTSKGAKVIILLTDGSNNAGEITPTEAAHMAKQKKIRVYTIGMGQQHMIINYSSNEINESDDRVDEGTLQKIASITSGEYFHASNEKVLTEIYATINDLEKRKIDENRASNLMKATPAPFIWISLICFFIFWFFNTTLFHTNE